MFWESCNFGSTDGMNSEQRERISHEMEVFMETSEREQRLHLSGSIPSIEAFWDYRLGSSAVFVVLGVNEYVALEPRSCDMHELQKLQELPLIRLKVRVG